MKRILIVLLVTCAVLAVSSDIPLAHATALDTNISNQTLIGEKNSADPKADPFADAAKTAKAAADLNAAAATPTQLDTGPQMNGVLAQVMSWIMSLFAWLLGVAAITLDNAVYYTVVTMGTYVKNLTAIGVTWRILRDIGNIMFIFGFLAVGITTILKVDVYGIKKMLPMLLVGAIFLNFSLFFAEAIIDVGNLFATQFYTQINGGVAAGAKNFDLASISTEGISNKIMSQLGLQSIYGSALTKSAVLTAGSSIFIGFMSIILFIVTAFVMFSLAFILIARFVALIFLIVVAPVGFAGLAVPGFADKAKEWWSLLFHQTITAPILMLMLYIALAVITDAHFLAFGGAPDWSGFVSSSSGATNVTGFAGMILSFLVAMGLLLLVVVYAKRWSAFGGDLATKTAAKMTFGLTAWGVNRTVGRGAYYLQRRALQSKTFNAVNARTGRVMTRALNSAATGSFDIRGSGVFGKVPYIDKIAMGDAAKDGFTGARKRNIEDHDKAVEVIEKAHKEGFNEKDRDKAIAKALGKEQEALGKINEKHILAERKFSEKTTITERFAEEVKVREAAIAAKPAAAVTKAEKDELEAARNNLNESKEDLAKSKAELNAAEASRDKAQKTFIENTTTEDGKKKAAATGLADNIKESKKAYAEGIEAAASVNPFNLIAYGPDSGAAAKKIRDSLVEKSKEAKVLDAIKIAYGAPEHKPDDAAHKTEKSGGDAAHAPAPKPAAAAPASAAGGGGGGHAAHH